jgi:hypothetical protein
LGGGPNEVNQDFYNRQQCSVFGCAVVYFDPVLQRTKTGYVDYFSDVLSHDGVYVKDCITHLIQNLVSICPRLQQQQGQQPVKKINIWTDVGPHFRCQEVAHFFLKKIPSQFNVAVQWNMFAECHGKSIVDGHFGLLSRWLKKIELKKKVTSINTLVELFNQKLIDANIQHQNNIQNKIKNITKNNIKNNINITSNELINKFFIYHQSDSNRAEYIENLYIPNISHYYHFESIFDVNINKCYLRIKMLVDSNRYEDKFLHKIKILTKKETRITKYGSKTTQKNSHKKMCLEGVLYGPNTRRRLQQQSQNL